MRRRFRRSLFIVCVCSIVACSNGEIGTANGESIDASSGDGAPTHHRDASATNPKPKPMHDASVPPRVQDAGTHHDATASQDATTPNPRRDAAPPPRVDGGRPLGTDRNDFFGSSRCATADVDLCEDFESGVIDKGTWEIVGSPTVGGAETARGQKALHILQNGNGAQFIREKKTFPAPNDTYWGRIFVDFIQLPASPMTYAHWTFVAASGTGVSGEIRLSGQFSNGANVFGVGTDNRTDPEGTGDWTSSDKDPGVKPVPLNEWLCIEWMHSGSIDETRFFVDGVEHPSLHTTPTVNGGNGKPYLLPDFTNVWVGWQEYQSSTETFELWVDEIAIDDVRIGCVI